MFPTNLGSGHQLQGGGGGGATKWEVRFYPYEKGDRESFSHPEVGGGGGTKSCGVVLTQGLEVFTILEGGTKGFHPLKGMRGVQSLIKLFNMGEKRQRISRLFLYGYRDGNKQGPTGPRARILKKGCRALDFLAGGPP